MHWRLRGRSGWRPSTEEAWWVLGRRLQQLRREHCSAAHSPWYPWYHSVAACCTQCRLVPAPAMPTNQQTAALCLQVVFTLERSSNHGSLSMKLTATRSFALPASPVPSRFLGLAALPDPAPRALPRLLAATEGGRVSLLCHGGPAVERSADLRVGAAHCTCDACAGA